MDQFQTLGKILVILGIFITIIGLVLFLGHKIPLIGRLPGDILIQRKNFTFYFPVTTLIIINLIILLIVYLVKK
ncbi:MAG: DUF2905 domain-containing protein [Calditrichaeota bacterium]|nr:DUF2905 domain-containing protein [Calditrichota bacterium]RQV99997.1 MAG: DUF2905 domain-containing protein [Calditrichota bacterium]